MGIDTCKKLLALEVGEVFVLNKLIKIKHIDDEQKIGSMNFGLYHKEIILVFVKKMLFSKNYDSFSYEKIKINLEVKLPKKINTYLAKYKPNFTEKDKEKLIILIKKTVNYFLDKKLTAIGYTLSHDFENIDSHVIDFLSKDRIWQLHFSETLVGRTSLIHCLIEQILLTSLNKYYTYSFFDLELYDPLKGTSFLYSCDLIPCYAYEYIKQITLNSSEYLNKDIKVNEELVLIKIENWDWEIDNTSITEFKKFFVSSLKSNFYFEYSAIKIKVKEIEGAIVEGLSTNKGSDNLKFFSLNNDFWVAGDNVYINLKWLRELFDSTMNRPICLEWIKINNKVNTIRKNTSKSIINNASVTKFCKHFPQPRGGFIKHSEMEVHLFNDKQILESENIFPGLIGLAVDYLTRYNFNKDAYKSFKISLLGASLISKDILANELLSKIKGLDDESITAACKLVGFDVIYRAGADYYVDIEYINPNKNTLNNIRIMVLRTIEYFKYKNIVDSGITFEGAYNNIISTGDGDFLSSTAIIDLKVSVNNPSKFDTLQILIYQMLLKNTHKYSDLNINRIEIFNPRLNTAYELDVKDINIEYYRYIYSNINLN